MKKIGIGVLISFIALIIMIISILVQQDNIKLMDENNYLDNRLEYYEEYCSDLKQQYDFQYDMTWFVSYNHEELLDYSKELLGSNDEMTFDDHINLLEKYGLKEHFYDNNNHSIIEVIDSSTIEYTYSDIHAANFNYAFRFYFISDPNESNIDDLEKCVKIGENFFIPKYQAFITGLGQPCVED